MAIQFAVALRNARLDAIESHIGAAPKLQIRTGPPAGVGNPAGGTLLVEITLPNDWMNDASGGSKTKLGTWSAAAIAAGTAGHFRLNTSGGTARIEGTVSGPGGGGDLILDNPNIAVDQVVTINTFTFTDGNA